MYSWDSWDDWVLCVNEEKCLSVSTQAVLMVFSSVLLSWHSASTLHISQVPGASCTIVILKYVMLMSTDDTRATGHVQCTWKHGEGFPIAHAHEMAIARAASDGLPARDLMQSLSQRAMHLTA